MANGENNRLRSIGIWKNRPNRSGSGSRGKLATFKINYINKFIKEENIKSVFDFGCGDLHISSKIEVDNYLGIDIVEHSHPKLIKPKNYKTIISRFDEFENDNKADLCMSLDVLYHILHDETKYLEAAINKIVEYSNKFIIIYAQDSHDKSFANWSGHMNNSPWRQIIEKEKVKLIKEQAEPIPGSAARFFVYEKL